MTTDPTAADQTATDSTAATTPAAVPMAADHDEAAAGQMWADYVAAHPDQAWDAPSVEHFGDTAALADHLLGLVLTGQKRATASLVDDFAREGQLLPRIGSHWIACDGAGRPRLVLRSTELRVGPVDSVDDAFARDEGEGDLTREDWFASHRPYWRRVAAARGETWDEDSAVVFERFAVAWPPERAHPVDGPGPRP